MNLLFSATVFVSAFLLFQVQPIISKAILPWFGGSPAVWTTSMVFFQAVLFGGYAYAHLSTQLIKVSKQGLLHIVLLLAACAFLPIVPRESFKPSGSEGPTWSILCLLTATLGLPYFVLSSTGPLLQSWFSRLQTGRSPYRLYALSNVGSLLALLTYPFVVEPSLPVKHQAQLWTAVFLGFILLCGGCAGWIARFGHAPSDPVGAVLSEGEKPGLSRLVLWLALPALASTLLLATTNHVCQDVAVIPFLWVVPLSLYLLSFILTFERHLWYQPVWFAAATVVLVIASVDNLGFLSSVTDSLGMESLSSAISGFQNAHALSYRGELAVYFSVMFAVCMICHGELARLRPAPKYLTQFYLMVSAGGVLGGLFVSLLAPHLFSTFFEWPLALGAGFALALFVAMRSAPKKPRVRIAWYSLGGLLVVGALTYGILPWDDDDAKPLGMVRNFYGVVSAWDLQNDDPKENFRALFHGRIPHGRQYVAPERHRMPISFYGENSGVSRAMHFLSHKANLRSGIIGLGIGTMAAFVRPGDFMRFYEINPAVLQLARKFFWYLGECPGKCEVKLGDARLVLERESPQNYDLLAVDAFSGDSIPVHLLTKEAFAIYQRHLNPDGILAVHISNRYLDLEPIVRAHAATFGWQVRLIHSPGERARKLAPSDWILLTKNTGFLTLHFPYADEDPPELRPDIPEWTDQRNNLFTIMRGSDD